MATESVEQAAPVGAPSVPRLLVPLLAGGMGLSMLVLYAIGSLAPLIADDLRVSREQIGLLTAVAFGTATLLSVFAGHLVDVTGGRRAFIVLSAVVAAQFALLASARSYWFLLAMMVVAGVPQSLANPSTNKLLVKHIPAQRRAFAVGVKQAGVPLAAFVAGLTLPSLARATSWRTALALVVPLALVAMAAAVFLPRDPAPASGTRLSLPQPPNVATRWLMAYSLCIGAGLSALNTYLALYAHQSLGMGTKSAGALVSAIGVSGIASRLLWGRYGDRLAEVPVSLLILAVAAIGSAVLVPAATAASWLVWIGALGLGGSAAAANAVTMVAVTKGRGFGKTGHASALVSMGFFSGFVVGPVSFGLLTDGFDNYTPGWILVVAVFVLAAVIALAGRRAVRASA